MSENPSKNDNDNDINEDELGSLLNSKFYSFRGHILIFILQTHLMISVKFITKMNHQTKMIIIFVMKIFRNKHIRLMVRM